MVLKPAIVKFEIAGFIDKNKRGLRAFFVLEDKSVMFLI